MSAGVREESQVCKPQAVGHRGIVCHGAVKIGEIKLSFLVQDRPRHTTSLSSGVSVSNAASYPTKSKRIAK